MLSAALWSLMITSNWSSTLQQQPGHDRFQPRRDMFHAPKHALGLTGRLELLSAITQVCWGHWVSTQPLPVCGRHVGADDGGVEVEEEEPAGGHAARPHTHVVARGDMTQQSGGYDSCTARSS